MVILENGIGESDMRMLKKLTLLLIFCLVLLGCGAALADVTISPVPEKRIQLLNEPGLKMTMHKSSVRLEIMIDTEGTDWPTVLTYGVTGEGGTELRGYDRCGFGCECQISLEPAELGQQSYL